MVVQLSILIHYNYIMIDQKYNLINPFSSSHHHRVYIYIYLRPIDISQLETQRERR